MWDYGKQSFVNLFIQIAWGVNIIWQIQAFCDHQRMRFSLYVIIPVKFICISLKLQFHMLSMIRCDIFWFNGQPIPIVAYAAWKVLFKRDTHLEREEREKSRTRTVEKREIDNLDNKQFNSNQKVTFSSGKLV